MVPDTAQTEPKELLTHGTVFVVDLALDSRAPVDPFLLAVRVEMTYSHIAKLWTRQPPQQMLMSAIKLISVWKCSLSTAS